MQEHPSEVSPAIARQLEQLVDECEESTDLAVK